jgi:hypothetical protein
VVLADAGAAYSHAATRIGLVMTGIPARTDWADQALMTLRPLRLTLLLGAELSVSCVADRMLRVSAAATDQLVWGAQSSAELCGRRDT